MSEQFGSRKGLKGLQLALITAILVFSSACSASLSQPTSDGAEVFQEKCAGCHTIGAGDLVGPDLRGVTEQRDPQWLAEFIAEPDKMFASGDSIASSLLQEYGNVAMPNLGLSQEQVTAVIAYLGKPTSQPASPSANRPAGDATRGQALFMGDIHFLNDGPPCMGCHNIGNSSVLGGGALGPDLTNASSRYNDASLAAALANLPWPTMKPIYAKHPLTPEEQTDLRAFIQTASSQRVTDKELLVIAISLVGFSAAVVFLGIIYRRRLRGVRRPLVERMRSGK